MLFAIADSGLRVKRKRERPMLDKLAEEERLAAKKKWLATPKRCRGLQLSIVKRMDHRFIVLSGYRSLKKPTMGKITGYQAFPSTGQEMTLTLALQNLGEPYGINAAFRLWPPDTVKFAVERALRETFLDCERPERETDERDVFTIVAWVRNQDSSRRSVASTITALRPSADPNPSQGNGVMAVAAKAAAAVAAGVMQGLQGLNRLTMGLFGGGLGLGPNNTTETATLLQNQQEPTSDDVAGSAVEITTMVLDDNNERADTTLHIGERGWDEGSLTSELPLLSPHPHTTTISPTPVADRVLLAATADGRAGDGNTEVEGMALGEGGVSALTPPFSPTDNSGSQVLEPDLGLADTGGTSLGGIEEVSALSLAFSDPGDKLRLDPLYRHVHTAYSIGHSSVNNDSNNHNIVTSDNNHGPLNDTNHITSGRIVGNLSLTPLSLVHARMGDRVAGPSPFISPPIFHPSHPIIIDHTTLPHDKSHGRLALPVQTAEGVGPEEGGIANSGDEKVAAGEHGEEPENQMDEISGPFRDVPILASAHDSDRAYYLRMSSFPLTHGLNTFMPEVEAKHFVSAWHNKRWQGKRAKTVHLDTSRSLGALYNERDACAYHLLHHFPLINYRQLPPLPPSGWSLAPSDHLILWKEARIHPDADPDFHRGHDNEKWKQQPPQEEEDEVEREREGGVEVVQSENNNTTLPNLGHLSVKRPRGPPPKQASNSVALDADLDATSGDAIAVVQPDSNTDIVASAPTPSSVKRPRGPPPKRPSSHISDTASPPDIVAGANAVAESSSSLDMRDANDGSENHYLLSNEPNKELEDDNQEEEDEEEEDDEDGIAWSRVEMDLADADVLLLPISPSEIPLEHQQALLQRHQEKLQQHRLQLQQQKLQLQQQLHHQQQQPEVLKKNSTLQNQPDEEHPPSQAPLSTDLPTHLSDSNADIVQGLSDVNSSQQLPLPLTTDSPPDRRSEHLPEGASEHSSDGDDNVDKKSSESSTSSPPQEGVTITMPSASASDKRTRGPPPKRPPPKAPPLLTPLLQPPIPADMVAISPEEAIEQEQGVDSNGGSVMPMASEDGVVLPSDFAGEEEEEEDNESVVTSTNAHPLQDAAVSVRFEPISSTIEDGPINVNAINEGSSITVDIDTDTLALTVSELNRSGVLKLVRAVGRPHPVALSRTSRRLLPHLHSSPYSSTWRANEQETYLTDRIAPYSKRRMDVQRGVRVANKSIKIDGVHVVYTIYVETTYPGLPPVPWRKEKNRTIWRKPVKGQKAPPGEPVLDFDTDTALPVEAGSSLEINSPASVMSLANQLSVHGDGGLFDTAVVDDRIGSSRPPLPSSELFEPSFASLTDSFVTHPLEARIVIEDEPRTEEEKKKETELANNPFGAKVSDAGNAKSTTTDKKGGKTKDNDKEEDGEDEEDDEEEEEEDGEEEEEEDDDDSSSSDDEGDDEAGWLDKVEPEAEEDEDDLAAMFQRMGAQPVALESADDLLNEMFDTIAPNAIVAIDLYLPFGATPRKQQRQLDPDLNPSATGKDAELPQSTSLRLRIPKEDLFLLVSDRRALLSVALRAAYRGFFDSAGEEETLAVEDSWDLIAHELMHKVRCLESPI